MAASDEGDVDFLVYGYMNRGTYEGQMGVVFYHYDEDSRTVQEKFFVPVSEGYDQLESDITTLAYLGEDGMTYLLLNGKVTGIDLNSNESVTVAYGLSREVLQSVQMEAVWHGRKEIMHISRKCFMLWILIQHRNRILQLHQEIM